MQQLLTPFVFYMEIYAKVNFSNLSSLKWDMYVTCLAATSPRNIKENICLVLCFFTMTFSCFQTGMISFTLSSEMLLVWIQTCLYVCYPIFIFPPVAHFSGSKLFEESQSKSRWLFRSALLGKITWARLLFGKLPS